MGIKYFGSSIWSVAYRDDESSVLKYFWSFNPVMFKNETRITTLNLFPKNIFRPINHFHIKHACIGCEFLKQTFLAESRFFAVFRSKSYFKYIFVLIKLTIPQKLVSGVEKFWFS